LPSLDERANRERLRRRAHLIRLRTSAINRTFGLLTQWGLRRNLTALRKPGAIDDLASTASRGSGSDRSPRCSALSTTSTPSSARSSASCAPTRARTRASSC
jgi:hypothetical protein